MRGYKGVECQSLEKDDDDIIILFDVLMKYVESQNEPKVRIKL